MPLRLLLVALLIGRMLPAQSITGTILGTVEDPGGLSVVGADVTLLQVTTSVQRRAKTTDNGAFSFPTVEPGQYSVQVNAAGFKTADLRSVILSASDTLSVGAIRLEVGNMSQSVTITAQGANVQTASSERASVITGSQVESLLIRGRNVTDLMQLVPGVVTAASSDAISRNWTPNVMGGRNNTNNLTVDGMATADLGNNTSSAISVSMDAVAEVKVLVANYQAEYGRMSGSNVEIVTKSGTQQFHGSGSYFNRNEDYNANNFFNNRLGLPRAPYRFNTVDYTIGGPVYIPKAFTRLRNKLFFFWAQEYWPEKTAQPVAQLTVPTALERQGNFSQSLDLNNKMIVIKDPDTGAPFPGNIIPANRIDPNGQAILNIFPQPNFLNRTISAGRYNYISQSDTTTPQLMNTLKLDYAATSKNLVQFTWSRHRDKEEGAVGLPTSSANWPQLDRTYVTFGNVFAGHYQRIFSPALINEFTLGYTRRPETEDISASELQSNQRAHLGFNLGQLYPTANPLGLIPNATFGGVTSPINLNMDGRTPLDQNLFIVNIVDNLTRISGAHILKAGIFLNRSQRGAQVPITFNGAIDFAANANNPLDTGNAFGNAILGVFNSYTEATSRPYEKVDINDAEWFVQDNWRVSKRLTLDLGIRWTLIQPMYEINGQASSFVPSLYNPEQAVHLIQPVLSGGKRMGVDPQTGTIYASSLIGAVAPAAGNPYDGLVVAAQDRSYPKGLTNSPGLKWGPRIGFAWDPFGKGKTAVRGGFGIFYNLQDFQLMRLLAAQAPIVITPIVEFGALSQLLASPGFLFPQSVIGLDKNSRAPTVMNMTFAVQHNIGWGTVVDLGYAGALGRHLPWQRNLGSIPFGADFNPTNADPTNPKVPLPPALLRPYPGYGDVNVREWAANSSYHSLQVSVNRRFAHGMQFGGFWTWSKAMDYNDTDFVNVSSLISPKIWNYGLAGFDRTHAARINYLWDVPSPKWNSMAGRILAEGWQLSGITSFVSGAPLAVGFTQVTATDITGSPTDGPRIVVAGNPILPKSQRTFYRNFNTGVFRLPAVGTIGNAAKAVIRGPGLNNWDIAAFKNFPIREPFHLQFRAEFYNAFNHTQFTALDTTARFDTSGNQVNSDLGAFTAAGNPRLIQLGVKLYF
jgi:hypothetical protein